MQLSEDVSRLTKEAKPPLVWFCIGVAAVDDFDYTAVATLHSLCALLREQGTRLIFFEVSDEVYAQPERSGIIDLVGKDAFYLCHRSCECTQRLQGNPKGFLTIQTRLREGDRQDNERMVREQKFLKICESGRSSGKYFPAAGSFSEPANNATCSCGIFARFVLQEVVIG